MSPRRFATTLTLLALGATVPAPAQPDPAARDAPEAQDPAQTNPEDGKLRYDTRTAPDADSILATNVEQTLQNDRDVDSMRIDISAKDGVVTLSGTVPQTAQRDRAAQLARGVAGVRDVRNEIRLDEPGAPAPGASPIPERMPPAD